MKKVIKILAIILSIILIFLMFSFIALLIPASQPWTKDYSNMYVDEFDVIDWEVMLNPPEKYDALEHINENLRKKVSNYMKKRNYKLSSGEQRFVTNEPTYRQLIKSFKFEKID